MPWFVVFEFAPPTAFGIWARRGMSSGSESQDGAIEEIREAFCVRGETPSRLIDVFQYEENQCEP